MKKVLKILFVARFIVAVPLYIVLFWGVKSAIFGITMWIPAVQNAPEVSYGLVGFAEGCIDGVCRVGWWGVVSLALVLLVTVARVLLKIITKILDRRGKLEKNYGQN